MQIFATNTVPETSASYVLAGIFAVVFLAIIWRCAWRGCRRGPLRSLASFIAFSVAGTLAWSFGSELGFAFLGNIGVPWFLRGILGISLTAALAWLAVFALVWRLGKSQISEATGENERPILGACVGCWIGFFEVGILVFFIAAAGTLADALHRRHRDSSSWREHFYTAAACARASAALVPGMHFIEGWTPFPQSVLRKINKTIAVLDDPAAARKFIFAAEVQSVVTLPAVYPVVNSPRIQHMIEARDVDGLLSDPAVNRMLDDADFRAAVSEIDYERLLDSILAARPEKD